uniref:Eukaryotic translation initiation factor 5A n=1 Tax=Aegilops tauschii subsp. strangulata TaxID=200361 RepID=A0A453B604_AEGTS
VGLRGPPLRVQGGRGGVQDLPYAGRRHPEGRLPRHQEPPLQGTDSPRSRLDGSVVEVSTSKTGKHGHAKCHFVALDIFNGKKLEDIVPSSHNCDVPHVDRTEYQLIDISEDGFVSLLTDNGSTKDDLKLPTDDAILTQLKDGFAEGKDLALTVMSAMGEEQICAVKDVGPR